MLEMTLDHRQGAFRLNADIAVPASGVTALFGHSGSGKTTLLRLLAGLDRPDRGVIRLGERTLVDTDRSVFVPPHRRRLGVVFQEARLFPHYRVRGNLTYARRRVPGEAVDRVASLLGIEALLDRMPGALSGGEARRVAIGRALLSDPDLLLMDEPLSGLDGARQQELLAYIQRLTREVDLPIVFISHDTRELAAVAERLVVLDSGRTVASGPLDDLLVRRDLTPWLGGFEAGRFLKARIEAHDPARHVLHLRLEDGQPFVTTTGTSGAALERLPPGGHVRLRVHRRDVALALAPQPDSSVRNQLRARIETIESGAPGMLDITLSLAGQALLSRVTREAAEALALTRGLEVVALVQAAAPCNPLPSEPC